METSPDRFSKPSAVMHTITTLFLFRIPTISVEDAHVLLIRYADSKCIHNKDTARDMNITSIEYQPRHKVPKPINVCPQKQCVWPDLRFKRISVFYVQFCFNVKFFLKKLLEILLTLNVYMFKTICRIGINSSPLSEMHLAYFNY